MTTKQIISLNLTRLRKKKGLRQREVANILGIKLQRYQAYEEGRATPPVDTLIKLKGFYKLPTIDDLLRELNLSHSY